STEKAFWLMSSKFWCRPSSPATSSSSTISAVTKERPCDALSVPLAPSCSSCRLTALTSIRSSRSSPSSKHCSERLQSEPSKRHGGGSDLCFQPSLRPNAPTTLPTPDTLQREAIML